MELPTLEKFKVRTFETLLTCPKIFFGAFLWEGFSLSCNCSDYAMAYYWLSGVGAAVGTHFGHVFAKFVGEKMGIEAEFNTVKELTKACLYAICVLLGPGTAWQSIVNDTDRWRFTFTGAFFTMWACSMLLFFTALTVFRSIITFFAERYDLKYLDHLKSSFYDDILLSFSVGCGDAFFMGTSAPENFEDNWLAPTFGVYPSTPVGTAMLSAGASTLCGFVIVQFVQNCIMKHTWTDPHVHNSDAMSLLKSALLSGKFELDKNPEYVSKA